MITYNGPDVAPVFVAGLMNDAWAQAQARTLRARASVNLKTTPILSPEPADLKVKTQFGASSLELRTGDVLVPNLLKDELTEMLRKFIKDNYPAIPTPNGAEAWERVVASFDGDPLDQALVRTRARIDQTWSARGIAIPPEVREQQIRRHDLLAEQVKAGSAQNMDIVRKTYRKEVDLTGYEIAMRAQLDALEAARAFLLGCVLAMFSKIHDEQARFERYKAELQSSFYRMLNAGIDSAGLDLDSLILARRIGVDASLSGEERKAFVFGQLAATALDECSSIASQASAAINKVSAGASVSESV